MADICLLKGFLAKVAVDTPSADKAVHAINLYNISQGLTPNQSASFVHSANYRLSYTDVKNRAFVLDLTLSDGVNLSVHARTQESDDLVHVVLFLKQLEGASVEMFWDKMQEKIFPRLKTFILQPLEEAGLISLRGDCFVKCKFAAEEFQVAINESDSLVRAFSCA
mmetsp:Transcript_1677/g.3594  ORF Transcript_1677/g.3594 Transcript_1677/m.3594 type:complete len:166 (-) Transcript_1677:338-835(-)